MAEANETCMREHENDAKKIAELDEKHNLLLQVRAEEGKKWQPRVHVN